MEPTLETIADKEPTLEDLQELIVNEEGTIHDLPHNSKASAVAQQPIVGNAVVLRGDARLT